LALQRPCNPDSCLYHVATIRWFEHDRIVPGLGNANLRLAFNHAYYLYASLFDVGLLRGHGERLANGLLLLGILVPPFWSCSACSTCGARSPIRAT